MSATVLSQVTNKQRRMRSVAVAAAQCPLFSRLRRGGGGSATHAFIVTGVSTMLALSIVLNIVGLGFFLLDAVYARNPRVAVFRRYDPRSLCAQFWNRTARCDRPWHSDSSFRPRHRADGLLARPRADPAHCNRANICSTRRACRLLRDVRSVRPHLDVRFLAAGLRRDRCDRGRDNGLGTACRLPARWTGRARKAGTIAGSAVLRPDEASATPSCSC
jgi:hypothetical protein